MSWTTAAAIYVIVWWITLFAVLPWGVRSQHESGEMPPGTDPGAPAMARLGIKLIWTTLVASVVFGLFYWAYTSRIATLEELGTLWGLIK
jgi:predicted secreted protein